MNNILINSYEFTNLITDNSDTKTVKGTMGEIPMTAILSTTNEKPSLMVEWGSTIKLSDDFLDKSFSINHPALRKYTYILKNLFLNFSKTANKEPLLYALIRISNLINKNNP